ncbi:MAG: putative glycogen synthase, ADP-glucose transglucosylase [Chthoniobacteraceae bacterium]|nr:putative glycogen synthase, ADP-glucose transglucosylase [Chthoniobacteraceae bacterium]
MKALFLTNEFPPTIYGGAGVHVDYLSRELSKLIEIEARCYGEAHREIRVDFPSLKATGFGLDTSEYTAPKQLHSIFGAVQRCVDWNSTNIDADIVHLHTWYTHFGGILAKLNYGIPMVLTVHSLEPLRPWKREQLGGGYDFSCWVEKTAIEMADAVIAVSSETKADVLRLFNVDEKKVHVIYNGIDLAEYQPVKTTEALRKYGIDPNVPFVLFVGRITRQKGIVHLVNAIKSMDPGFQIVLCAGAPDTPEIAREMKAAVDEARAHRGEIIWIEEMVNKATVYELYSHAAVFCCPSIYEPFGIINLEAMACETAVVASAVGGIKEVVVHGETGYLVPIEQMTESPFEPMNPEQFSKDLAARINELMADPALREKMGKAGRRRAVEKFSWESIAQQTHALYKSLLKQ